MCCRMQPTRHLGCDFIVLHPCPFRFHVLVLGLMSYIVLKLGTYTEKLEVSQLNIRTSSLPPLPTQEQVSRLDKRRRQTANP